MSEIYNHLDGFEKALCTGRAVRGATKGRWLCEGKAMKVIRWITRTKDVRILSVGMAFYQAMDQLEKKGVANHYNRWSEVQKLVVKQMAKCQSNEAKKIVALINARLLALKYRSEVKQDKPLTQDEKYKLGFYARQWKSNQWYLSKRKWEKGDSQILQNLFVNYPDFCRLLLKHKSLRAPFWRWTLQNRLVASIFIKFPKSREFIDKLSLASSIQMAGGHQIKVQKKINKFDEKVQYVTLPILSLHKGKVRTKDCSIWDKNRKLVFPYHYTTTLKEVFGQLKIRNKNWINFIFSINGIENWNASYWGYTGQGGKSIPIEIEKDKWINKVPPVEKLTLEEAQKRYGKTLNGKNYGVALRATRKYNSLNVDRTHSFLELLFPTGEGGYSTIHLGKFTKKLPQSFKELFLIIGNTVPATIVSHDLNATYNWRQKTHVSRVIEKEQFYWFAEKLRQSILEAKRGNIPFQIYANSCSHWSQDSFNMLLEHIGENKENFFYMPVDASEPNGILGKFKKIPNALPKRLRPQVYRFLFLILFWPWRSLTITENGRKRKISFYRSKGWNDLMFHNPAFLFHQQKHQKKFWPAGEVPDWLKL